VATTLAIEAGAEQQEVKLPEEYEEFARLFSDEAADRFPPSREWDHAIDLKPGAPDALDCKVYPMTRDEDTALEKFLDEMVAKGYIHPSKSPYASPVTFFLLIIVHITDYHWDRHLYFVIHSHHAQTMTHTPPSDDSILILRLVVLVACDSD
jgi:hypothetical protein